MKFFSSWIQGIIVAVVVATILEMILPNGNSKKYIRIVIGIYIIFNIISPIVSKFTGKEVNLDSILNISKYEEEISSYEVDSNKIENSNQSNVKEIYILSLKKDIKSKVEDKGYFINNIYVDVEDDEQYTIKNIKLTMHKKNNEEIKKDLVSNIEKINIKVDIDNKENNTNESTDLHLSNSEISEVKQYISNTYEVDIKNIEID